MKLKLEVFREIQPDLREKLSGLVLVGPPGEPSTHLNILDAFHACEEEGSFEAKFLIENYDLKQKMTELLKKEAIVSKGELASLTPDTRKAEISRLRREISRLKKLQSFYFNDMVRQAYHRHRHSPDSAEKTDLIDQCHRLLQGLNMGLV